MFVKIKSIEILPNFKIKALFDCNVVKTYDFNALIKNHKAFKDLQQESLFKQECTALTVVDQSREAFHFVRIFIRKLKKLFKLNRRAINDYNENGQRN